MTTKRLAKIEWPTLALFTITYLLWLSLTVFHAQMPIVLVLVVLVLLVTLHSSLQHEVIHGHPTPWAWVNTALAFPSLGMAFAYRRYELLHLKHHRNWLLTDPHEDSESYFFSRKKWQKLNSVMKTLYGINNTLAGRLTIGPALMLVGMCRSEFKLCLSSTEIRNNWLMHLVSVGLVFTWLVLNNFSILLYVLCVVYPALSVLMLRSFSEHLPEKNIDHRSAIIESNWFMQLLYLNNNYHRVHHAYPGVAWYELPKLYRQHYQKDTTHVYNGYSELFKRYGFVQRFPVEHPFLGKD